MYINSNDIKVFPTSKRDDIKDRNARLNSEQNLISLINRLTDIKSFVISGLTINNEGTILSPGSCNINGYYFELINIAGVSLTSLGTPSSGDKLYFNIDTNTTQVDNVTFSELIGADNAAGWYTGLNLLKSTTVPAVGFSLELGYWNGSKWVTSDNRTIKFTQNSVVIDDGELY